MKPEGGQPRKENRRWWIRLAINGGGGPRQWGRGHRFVGTDIAVEAGWFAAQAKNKTYGPFQTAYGSVFEKEKREKSDPSYWFARPILLERGQ